MRIVWLRRAIQNLDEAALWIAKDNPRAAVCVVARIRRATERLADHPESGRPGRIAGTRELVVPGLPYIVAYGVTEQQVEILFVQHAAREWPDEA